MLHAVSLVQLDWTVSAGAKFAGEQTILTGIHYYSFLDVIKNAELITYNIQQLLHVALPSVLSNQTHTVILSLPQSCTDTTVDAGLFNNLAIETQICSGFYPQLYCDVYRIMIWQPPCTLDD